MVNTRIDTDLSAAVQNALQTLLPQIREEILVIESIYPGSISLPESFFRSRLHW
nr:hypothetical protein [Tanacetum cinerariifolium]